MHVYESNVVRGGYGSREENVWYVLSSNQSTDKINLCFLAHFSKKLILSGPGYAIDKLGVPQPIDPESEGSSVAKGPGYFYQPYALVPGTSTDAMLGDEQSKLTEDELAFVCKVTRATLVAYFVWTGENCLRSNECRLSKTTKQK